MCTFKMITGYMRIVGLFELLKYNMGGKMYKYVYFKRLKSFLNNNSKI